MNQAQSFPLTGDQLINQIILQGKAKRTSLGISLCRHSMAECCIQLRPVPGSRDHNSTNPNGRAFRKARPPKARCILVSAPLRARTQRIQYPPWRCKSIVINHSRGGVTKS